MASKVTGKITSDIKNAKYYAMIFDTTPDLANRDQMSHVIRYVNIEDDKVEIRESFLGFFEIHDKTAEGLVTAITDRLLSCGLSLSDCRGQAYDNAAVMSGRKSGVQRRILELIHTQSLFRVTIIHSIWSVFMQLK